MMNRAPVSRTQERLRDRGAQLRLAVKEKNLDTVTTLIAAGADVNDFDAYGNTALMMASDLGDIDIVTELLNAKAAVQSIDKMGQTALMFAAFNGHFYVVKTLLEHRATDSKVTSDGQTALMKACYARHRHTLQIVSLLVESGSGVNKTRKDGRTSCMIAGLSGSIDVIEYLIASKADLTLTDNKGETALHLAAAQGNFGVVTGFVRWVHGAEKITNKQGLVVTDVTKFTPAVFGTFSQKQAEKALQECVKEGIRLRKIDKENDTGAKKDMFAVNTGRPEKEEEHKGPTLFLHDFTAESRAIRGIVNQNEQLRSSVVFQKIDVFKGAQRRYLHMRVNKAGVIPCMSDPTAGVVLNQGGDILIYLLETYAKSQTLYPDGNDRQAVDAALLRNAQLLQAADKYCTHNMRVPEHIRKVLGHLDGTVMIEEFGIAAQKLDTLVGEFEQLFFKGGKYMCGSWISIADYLVFHNLHQAVLVGGYKLQDAKKVSAWMAMMSKDPAVVGIVEAFQAEYEEIKKASV